MILYDMIYYAIAQALLMSFTSTPMPCLLGADWTHLFPARPTNNADWNFVVYVHAKVLFDIYLSIYIYIYIYVYIVFMKL